MKIEKEFTQKYVQTDMEGKHWNWVDSNKTYEELVDSLKANAFWTEAVRLVVKTFDSETFEITTKVIKTTKKIYNGWHWEGEVEEV